MNSDSRSDHQEPEFDLEFAELIVRYQDGALTPAETDQLSELIARDSTKRELFQKMQLRTAAIHDLLRIDAFAHSSRLFEQDLNKTSDAFLTSSHDRAGTSQGWFSRGRKAVLAAIGASLSLAIAVGYFSWQVLQPTSVVDTPPALTGHSSNVFFVEETRARFFGPSTMATGDVVKLQQDYMLQSGIVKLAFPSGATAILESPAVFQVATMTRLILSTGACSVHAPPGAEGFEVSTPLSKVVDRGTRFYVNVRENSETEVHVVEGIADLYPSNFATEEMTSTTTQDTPVAAAGPEMVRLTDGEALRLGGFTNPLGQKTPFQPDVYRAGLSDRLVRYEASSTPGGTADELLSLTVQRDGQLHDYAADELIPIQVTWYRADPLPDTNGSLCGFRERPPHVEEWLEDRKLATGLINFGGQLQVLYQSPVVPSKNDPGVEGTPGLGIRFVRPVVNSPGPDVVFFEIQSFANAPDGDAFHVYPMTSGRDLHPLTIKKFDLTMDSPQARVVSPLWSHRFPQAIESLSQLQASDASLKVDVGHLRFRVIGVGIDLSDLGYVDGDEVDELFFQHAADEGSSKVDPVYIAGLPRVVRR